MEGSAVSIFTVSESELEFPARSDTEQFTECEPSLETLNVQGPEPESVAGASSTVQAGEPSRPGPPAVWETVMAGSVVSIFTVSESELWFPARSWTEHSTECEPSLETLNVQGPEPESVPGELSTVQAGEPSRPLPPSEAGTVSVTGEVTSQPLEPSEVWEMWIAGAVVSRDTAAALAVDVPGRA